MQRYLLMTSMCNCNNDHMPVVQEELRTNPFLRCDQPALAAYTGKSDPRGVLAELRRRKDSFGGLLPRVLSMLVNCVNSIGPLARYLGIRN